MTDISAPRFLAKVVLTDRRTDRHRHRDTDTDRQTDDQQTDVFVKGCL